MCTDQVYEVSLGPVGTALAASLLHSGAPLTAGHYKDELWGLDMSPDGQCCVTSGTWLAHTFKR
jgi:hypothetical protein